MLNKLFSGIFEESSTQNISIGSFFLCMVFALIIGIFLAAVYIYKSKYTQSFVVTLAIIPASVSMVIMLVNGNFGAGLAVAGAFSLIRFRSMPGSAKEIGAIFIAMTAGLACGMGYIGYAVLFAAIMGGVVWLYSHFDFGKMKNDYLSKTLRITIPENLDYTGIFDNLFEQYTTSHKLVSVKTTNMGSMFKLIYEIKLTSADAEKEFIDELRCRNGNLEISINDVEFGLQGAEML